MRKYLKHLIYNTKTGLVNIAHGINHLIHGVVPKIPLSDKLHVMDKECGNQEESNA